MNERSKSFPQKNSSRPQFEKTSHATIQDREKTSPNSFAILAQMLYVSDKRMYALFIQENSTLSRIFQEMLLVFILGFQPVSADK